MGIARVPDLIFYQGLAKDCSIVFVDPLSGEILVYSLPRWSVEI